MQVDILDALKSSEIFAELTEVKLKQLASLMEVIELDSGEILFEQGSKSNCLYLLTKGALEAILQTTVGEGKVAGTIKAGQTVGEMGLLSTRPRTLTVKALRHSTLLKLTKESFNVYFVNEPELLLRLVNIIIARSKKQSICWLMFISMPT